MLCFLSLIARERPHWCNVPLLDVQQMHVEGALERCIRFLIHVNWHILKFIILICGEAQNLRPDRNLAVAVAGEN